MNYIVVLIIIIISLYFIKKNSNSGSSRISKINSKIPSPLMVPVFGNLISMNGELHLKFYEWYKQLGCIYRIKAGSVECVVLTGYPTLRKAFIENSQAFQSRYRSSSKLQLNGSQDIAFENGERHSILKKIVLSEMTATRIKRMEDHIIQETQKLIGLLDAHIDSFPGKPIQLNDYLHMYSLNIILRFLFGIDFPYDQVQQTEGIIKTIKDFFIEAGKPIPSDFISFMGKENPKKHPYFVTYAKLEKEVEKLIEKYQIDNGSTDGHQDQQNESILSKLIHEYQHNKTIAWEGVTNTAIDIVAAGSDTSANTMLFCIIALTNNQDIQSKVASSISSSTSNNETFITHSKYRSSIPYLSMVIKETFRKYPIAVLGIPHETTEDVEIDGYKIASGTVIFQNIYSSHRSEQFFESPDEFIPERFINNFDSNLNYGSQNNLVQFGCGVRDCIGKSLAECEIFTLLGTLLNRYQFINPNDQPLSDIGKFGLAYQPPLTSVIIKKRV